MSISRRRVRAILRKELPELRRNNSLVAAMAIVATSLLAFDVVHPTVGVAVGCAAVLLLLDGLGWRLLAVTLDPERLIAGARRRGHGLGAAR